MNIHNREKAFSIKKELFEQLKEEHAFWSYDTNSINISDIDDDFLISMTMRYLDLHDIELLFEIYSNKKIKNVWKKYLVPEGDFLYTLNRFFAWYYFNAKRPDSYLKSLQTRHLNSLHCSHS